MGGGVGGLCAAAELGRAGLSVLRARRRAAPRRHGIRATGEAGFTFPTGPLGFSSPRYVRRRSRDSAGRRRTPLQTRRVPRAGLRRRGAAVAAATAARRRARPALSRGRARHRGVLRAAWASSAQALRSPGSPRSAALLEEAQRVPAAEYLAGTVGDRRLQRILGSMGTEPPSLGLPLLAAMWRLMSEVGIWYPAGGMGAFCERLGTAARDAGVEVRLRTRVAAIRVARGRARGVELEDGTVVDAEAVVSDADYKTTVLRLLDAREIPGEWRAAVAAARQTASNLQVALGLDASRCDLSAFDDGAAGSSTAALGWRSARRAGSTGPRPAQSTPPSSPARSSRSRSGAATTRHLAPPGGAVLVIRTKADHAHFARYRPAPRKRVPEYAAYKRRLGEALVEEVERLVPGLTDAVRVVDVATPLTFEERGGRAEGAVAGWSWARIGGRRLAAARAGAHPGGRPLHGRLPGALGALPRRRADRSRGRTSGGARRARRRAARDASRDPRRHGDGVTGQRYQIRPPTDDDISAVLELQVACDVDEHGEPDSTIEDLATQWGQRGFDLQRDAWLAVDRDEQIVAYAWVEDRTPNVDIEADVLVHPAHRRGDLGRELLARAGRRAAEHVAGAPPDARIAPGRLLRRRQRVEARAAHRRGIRAGAHLLPHEHRPRRPGGSRRPSPRTSSCASSSRRPTRAPCTPPSTRPSPTSSGRGGEAHEDWEQRLLKRPDFDPALWLVAWDGGGGGRGRRGLRLRRHRLGPGARRARPLAGPRPRPRPPHARLRRPLRPRPADRRPRRRLRERDRRRPPLRARRHARRPALDLLPSAGSSRRERGLAVLDRPRRHLHRRRRAPSRRRSGHPQAAVGGPRPLPRRRPAGHPRRARPGAGGADPRREHRGGAHGHHGGDQRPPRAHRRAHAAAHHQGLRRPAAHRLPEPARHLRARHRAARGALRPRRGGHGARGRARTRSSCRSTWSRRDARSRARVAPALPPSPSPSRTATATPSTRRGSPSWRVRSASRRSRPRTRSARW